MGSRKLLQNPEETPASNLLVQVFHRANISGIRYYSWRLIGSSGVICESVESWPLESARIETVRFLKILKVKPEFQLIE